MPQQITAWSFSRFQTYASCPAKAKYKFIDKLQEPPNDAMARGTAIHKLAEDYTRAKKPGQIPTELIKFEDQFIELNKSKPLVEQEWAFTQDWQPTGWFAKDTWVRVKVDAACLEDDTLYVIDHKTGKEKDDHKEQLSIYGVAGLIQFPLVQIVSAQLWYLDSGVQTPHEFSRKELPALKKDWEKQTKAMLTDTRFSPKPSNACRWCAFSKEKGGPCRF